MTLLTDILHAARRRYHSALAGEPVVAIPPSANTRGDPWAAKILERRQRIARRGLDNRGRS